MELFATPQVIKLARLKQADRPHGTSTVTNNSVHNYGHNVTAAAGGDITAITNITLTHAQILQQLAQRVQDSDLPKERKSKIVSMLQTLMKEAALQGMKISVQELLASAPNLFGGP